MEFLNQLNSEQQEAVKTIEGPLLVLAGAGSGKTRVVTFRIIYLLMQGVPASKILGLTFTNKAAQEMRERVQKLTQSDVLISTFHSLGVRMLRESIQVLGYRRNFAIYDEEDSNKLISACLETIGCTAAEAKAQLKIVRGYISTAKNNLEEPDYDDNLYCSKVYELYQEKLKEYHAVDFDDLLYLPVKILKDFPAIREYYQHRWMFLLIDEYQDTNNAQYELVKYLLGKEPHLCVVGDPDQSIYSWRGANIQNIMNFEKDYPQAKVVRLEQNYRSRSNILDAANALISYNQIRYEKNLWTGRGEGDKIKLFTANTAYDEAEFVARQLRSAHDNLGVPWSRMTVLYRTHALSRAFEDAFYLKHIPYVIMGGVSFYQRREIKDVLSMLKMVQSNSDYIAFSRSINLPKRGIGPATLDKIRLGASSTKTSIFEYCEKLLDKTPPIKLSLKQKEGLGSYIEMVRTLREMEPDCPLQKLVEEAIHLSDYFTHLREEAETYEDRKDNLASLVAKAAEWQATVSDPSLAAFLEELSLKSSLDEADSNRERVHLMTIHNVKGLEYDTVFLVGLEEEIFPHSRSRESHKELEEERRLCYVGMTRAQERLYISHVMERFVWGTMKSQRPSRFIKEIPLEHIERIKSIRRF
ncbi:MAG: UvrD-helicase domain-containing protein [Parachlamydiaceae bacterium]|nr:UvrD-helicase domain-containing protein [Parachlamydiaceae bacterium]